MLSRFTVSYIVQVIVYYHIYPPSQKARERGALIVKEPFTLEDKYGKVRLAVLQTVREDN